MEPEQLRRGKEFHKLVQANWQHDAQGGVNIEHTINLFPSSSNLKHMKKGRLDIFVDELGDYVAVVEIKSTNWDSIKQGNIRKLLSSHRRQVWKYITKYLDKDNKSVCAGIIYPNAPNNNNLQLLIESYLNDYGLQVVWFND